MKKPIVEEVFADNGEHSHWKLIDSATSETLWEQPDDSQNSGKPLVSGSLLLPKCKCGQNALPYKAQIEIDKCSRCGNDR